MNRRQIDKINNRQEVKVSTVVVGRVDRRQKLGMPTVVYVYFVYGWERCT
jgi:hypothetical protein